MQAQEKKKRHGQYFTDAAYGSLLVNRFQEDAVSVALELGVGGGALLSAVNGRWPDARCISVDIDPMLSRSPFYQPQDHHHYCADALSPQLEELIGLPSGVADLAVCNPPFIAADWKPNFSTLLSRAGFPVPSKALKVGADILFLAQNLWLLKDKGQLGIIIPSGIISGERNYAIRDALLSQHCITEIVELPDNAFKGTEVKTFILNLEKNKPGTKKIALYRCNKDGCMEHPIWISQEEAKSRMDYSYYKWRSHSKKNVPKQSTPTLTVLRGSVTTSEALKNEWRIFHTTDLKDQTIPGEVNFSEELSSNAKLSNKVIAKAGDILIPRVGRNILSGIRIVKSGLAPISDCLYVLRTDNRPAEKLYRALTSEDGQSWLQAHIHGACAKFITKNDLENFPF
ncbi:N-6 DNA methylase [Pseudomonas fulva]|uniref:N-6 DNA methylase n=1 Tax=Pseudomonas fulva TaxID=47880 RepID=UPI002446E301|nr:N-6 DNA methylase [Pseudomonas fulva]MDH0617133.1 N-6 DNA methylase [Pseudomonas fulva]